MPDTPEVAWLGVLAVIGFAILCGAFAFDFGRELAWETSCRSEHGPAVICPVTHGSWLLGSVVWGVLAAATFSVVRGGLGARDVEEDANSPKGVEEWSDAVRSWESHGEDAPPRPRQEVGSEKSEARKDEVPKVGPRAYEEQVPILLLSHRIRVPLPDPITPRRRRTLLVLPPMLLLGASIANLLFLPLWWSVFLIPPDFQLIPSSVQAVTSLFLFVALGLLLGALVSVEGPSLRGPFGWVILDLAFAEELIAFGCTFVIAFTLVQPPLIIA